MTNQTDNWIVAYTADNLNLQAYKSSTYKDASKYATMMMRNGYEIIAIFQEKAKDFADWDEFYKNQLSGLDTI